MSLECGPCAGGIDDDRICQACDRVHAPTVTFSLARARIFGKLNRDQVVDEKDKLRPRTLFEPPQRRGPIEMVVRDQQIDEAVAKATDARVKRGFALEKKLESETTRNDQGAGPLVIVRAVPPVGPERFDEADAALSAQGSETAPIGHGGKAQSITSSLDEMTRVSKLDTIDAAWDGSRDA
jgi:hypothetical protein